tara:strand:+ start:5489 stop:5626 length:138 start_codon:yes stop_codon:yes gene_type:complete
MRPKVDVSKIKPPIKNIIGAYFEFLLIKFLKALFVNLTIDLFMKP